MSEEMKIIPDYKQRLRELREEMTADLQELVRINSVQGKPVDGAPFGTGVRDAYDYMMGLGRRENFLTEDADGYGGHIDYGTDSGNGSLGILVHLDVVPEGEGWTYGPFSGEIVDGEMYGRGTMDDKGPAISAFYAMKALHDCGYIPGKRVRMIIGLDEETGSTGMEYYKQRFDMPDAGLVPDGNFPLVRGEMGIMMFDLVKKFGKPQKGGIQLRKITGGSAYNMVADSACALINAPGGYDDIRREVEEFAKHSQYSLSSRVRGKSLEIKAEGISAHGAMPWKGKNAISMLMEFLGTIRFNCDEVNDFVAFYNDHIGFRLHGERIGCELEDEVSGKLIFNVGMIDTDKEKGSICINVRYPVTLEAEDVYSGMSALLGEHNIGVVKQNCQEPLYYPENDPMVQTLLKIYRDNTGDMTEPLIIGGGTYAREMDNAMAFGAMYPDDVDLMHQKDERVKLENVMKTAEIYADAIYELAVKPYPVGSEEDETQDKE
ncbi:MAG: dipeptidase PepV [Clostridia bacterium]|nr:dipeptidase PepV [Clostridia bacterium]